MLRTTAAAAPQAKRSVRSPKSRLTWQDEVPAVLGSQRLQQALLHPFDLLPAREEAEDPTWNGAGRKNEQPGNPSTCPQLETPALLLLPRQDTRYFPKSTATF